MARPIRQITAEIVQNWKKPYFLAVPYLEAMAVIDTTSDMYHALDGKSIVLAFLDRAQTWRGPIAERIKSELLELLD